MGAGRCACAATDVAWPTSSLAQAVYKKRPPPVARWTVWSNKYRCSLLCPPDWTPRPLLISTDIRLMRVSRRIRWHVLWIHSIRRVTMMPRRAFIVTSVAPLLTGAGSFTTAEAASFWDVVGDVRIGGVHFAVGFHSSRHPRYRRYRGRYYRTRQRLQYRRYRCGGACHRHDGYDYHHEACPLFGAHR